MLQIRQSLHPAPRFDPQCMSGAQFSMEQALDAKLRDVCRCHILCTEQACYILLQCEQMVHSIGNGCFPGPVVFGLIIELQ